MMIAICAKGPTGSGNRRIPWRVGLSLCASQPVRPPRATLERGLIGLALPRGYGHHVDRIFINSENALIDCSSSLTVSSQSKVNPSHPAGLMLLVFACEQDSAASMTQISRSNATRE